MDKLPWLILLGGITLLTIQWLLSWSLSPLNRQAIRFLFVQQVLALCGEARLVSDEEEQCVLQCGAVPCTIRLDAIYRACREAPEEMSRVIRDAAQAVQAALHDAEALPADWRDRVMPLLFNRQSGFAAQALHRPVIGDLAAGYVLPGDGAFRWIAPREPAANGVDAAAVEALAMRNLERSCNALLIDALPQGDGTDHVLHFATADGFDAARLLVPSFYRRFSPRFGDEDVMVAVPTRDTLIMVAATDRAQAHWLAWRTDAEFTQRPFPLCNVPIIVTDDGLELWMPDDEG